MNILKGNRVCALLDYADFAKSKSIVEYSISI